MPTYYVFLVFVSNGANGARVYTFGALVGTTWLILGAILGPAGRQGAPKIDLFGTKSHQNLKKKNYREKGERPIHCVFIRFRPFGAI